MECIRKATAADASRIAEILVFTKRMNYRHIFQDDKGSFGELQVLPLAQSYLADPKKEHRDRKARRDYFDMDKNRYQKGDLYVISMIDEEMRVDDMRLR